jgi:sugar lactone lactonase YvrE
VGDFDKILEFDVQLNRTTFASGFAHVAAITKSSSGYLVTDGDRGAILSYRSNGERIAGATIGGGAQGIGAIVASAHYDADTLLFLENQKGYIYAYSLSTGAMRLFAGNGRLEEARTLGHSSQTGFYYANAIAVDSEKNVYVAENYRILKIGADGMMSLFAGSRDPGDNPSGTPALEARFTSIRGMAFDAQDNLYVADYGNSKVKRISNGVVDVVAGNGVAGAAEYGRQATETSLNHPVGLLPLADGTVLIADSWNNTIVRLEVDGRLTQVAGSQQSTTYQGYGSFSGDGGPATAAGLNTPAAMAYSEDGSTLYIVDGFNNRVRAVLPDGTITTVWGEGSSGYRSDGSLLNLPSAIMVVGEDLIVCDVGNGLVSRIHVA